MPEMKSRKVRGSPVTPCRPHTSTSESMLTPELSLPEGGRANGVPRSVTAKRYASTSPSTKTGVEKPTLAKIMEPTSTAELRRYADDAERDAHEDGEEEAKR